MKVAQVAAANSTTVTTNQSKSTTSMIDKDAKKRERQIRRQIEEIEQTMQALDTTIATLEEQLCNPDIFSNHEKAFSLQTELDEAKEQHESYELDWLTLNEELENL